MSYERGLQALNLEMPSQIPHTESIDNGEFVRLVTGLDPGEPGQSQEAVRRLCSALDYDIVADRVVDPGDERSPKRTHHGWDFAWSAGEDVASGAFRTEEVVLGFDPVEHYGLPDLSELTKKLQRSHTEVQRSIPGTVVGGACRQTLFDACADTFGSRMFLISAGQYPDRFDKVLEGFFRLAMVEIEAWAQTDIKFLQYHDNIVWTHGPVLHPEWYRTYMFPRYEKLWRPLREKGIKVLFSSDGWFDEFVDDLVLAGADGLMFEQPTSLELMVEKYGVNKIIIGNIDYRVLQFGTEDEIKAEVKRCAGLGRGCPGYFFSASNRIPPEVPVASIQLYLSLIRALSMR